MTFGPLRLHLLDVGQGESILIDLPDGAFGLVDGGPRTDARGIIKLIDERITEGRSFCFVAITHRDQDHIAGLPVILDRYLPEMILLPAIEPNLLEQMALQIKGQLQAKVGRALDRVLAKLDRAGTTRVLRLAAGSEVRDLPKIELFALSPDHGCESDLRDQIARVGPGKAPSVSALKGLRNRASLVLWLRAFGRNLLLPGEIEPDQVRDFYSWFGSGRGQIHYPRQVCWFKLPHHGAHTGGTAELVQFMAATDAFVASAAHGGRYGHPHPTALASIRRAGGRPMCTRLGFGCHLSLTDPRYPADEAELWATGELVRQSPPNRPCYGRISVTIWPDGRMEVQGGEPGPVECAFGGPHEPLIQLG